MEAVRARNMFSKLTLFYADDSGPADAAGIDTGKQQPQQQARGPLCLVRGEGQYVYDDEGRRYLDCVNNVRFASRGWMDSMGRSVGVGESHTHIHTHRPTKLIQTKPEQNRWRTSGTPTRRSSGRRRGSCGRSTPTRGPSPPSVNRAVACAYCILYTHNHLTAPPTPFQPNPTCRYHHPGRSRYAKKLLALFPPELDAVFFVNSGSEGG